MMNTICQMLEKKVHEKKPFIFLQDNLSENRECSFFICYKRAAEIVVQIIIPHK
jgi:hypothetical protein